MKQLRIIMKSETGKIFKKSTISAAILLMFIGLIFLQFGVDEFEGFQKKSSILIKTEHKKLSTFVNTALYGITGLKKIGIPCNLFPITYNSPFRFLQVFIDVAERLNINNPQIIDSAFAQTQGDNIDLSWYFPLIIGMIVLIWGYFATWKKQELFRFYLNFAGEKKVFWGMVLARIIFFIFFLLLTFLFIFIQLRVINRIVMSASDISSIFIFLAMSLLILSVFLIIGMRIGYLKSTLKAGILMFATWFCFTIFIPKVFNVYFAKNARSVLKTIYQHELQKLSILTEYEKTVYDRIKRAKTKEEKLELNKQIYANYLKETFTKIIDLEQSMVENIKKSATTVQIISIFTPVTFYKSVNNELSSFGLNGFIHLYKESIKDYEQFVHYCIENRTSNARPKDNPFIKNPEDYVVQLESTLPKYFGVGVLFNLFILSVLTWSLYSRFKQTIFPKTKNSKAYRDIHLKLLSGKLFVFSYNDDDRDFPAQLYNALSGVRKYPGKITIDDKELAPGEKQDFCYIPLPETLPGNIKNKKLINLFSSGLDINKEDIATLKKELSHLMDKRFEEVKEEERIELLTGLAKLKNSKIYILDNIFFYSPLHEAREICKKCFDTLKGENTLIIETAPIRGPQHSYFYRYHGYSIDKESMMYNESNLGVKS